MFKHLKKSSTTQKKKKMEFSKKLVIWALIVTTVCITVSYTLSMLDKDSCQEVTVSVATACIAIAVSYEAKSLGEKHSRNKYGIDEDGNRILVDGLNEDENDSELEDAGGYDEDS